jgi:glucosamine-6-phosphate deaminase
LNIKVYENKTFLSRAAAEHAAFAIRNAIRDHGKARIIAATGTSQLEFLAALTTAPDIDWRSVELFHLDEYISLPPTHPASFRKYLMDHLIRPTGISTYHLLDGNDREETVLHNVGKELNSAPIDIAFVGIGENGHLAFNDPPADFQTQAPYLIVELDEACRRQQVGEGWFADISEVPKRAISMSIPQILKSKEIVVVVPEARKAKAVKACFEGEISPRAPASALRLHKNTTVFLDAESASLLNSTVQMPSVTKA